MYYVLLSLISGAFISVKERCSIKLSPGCKINLDHNSSEEQFILHSKIYLRPPPSKMPEEADWAQSLRENVIHTFHSKRCHIPYKLIFISLVIVDSIHQSAANQESRRWDRSLSRKWEGMPSVLQAFPGQWKNIMALGLARGLPSHARNTSLGRCPGGILNILNPLNSSPNQGAVAPLYPGWLRFLLFL